MLSHSHLFLSSETPRASACCPINHRDTEENLFESFNILGNFAWLLLSKKKFRKKKRKQNICFSVRNRF